MTALYRPEAIRQNADTFAKQFDVWFESYLLSRHSKPHFVKDLWASKTYSVRSGGKRFRPFLTFLVFQIFHQDLEKIRNYCLAIEMVHTYSLIHDDLPCMDDDDLRRGKSTNHKVFGEATALLAGDALLTEAFYLISHDQQISPNASLQLIQMLSEKIGSFGMVGGQVLDMNSTAEISFSQLEEIHLLKTGYLIQAAALGGAIIAGADADQLQLVSQFSLKLGLAFQIKDDLLDVEDKQQDHKSYLAILGKTDTEAELKTQSDDAKAILKLLNSTKTQALADLVEYNILRNS